jgi:hypothetical protein
MANETFADIRKDAEAKFRELVEAYMQRRSAFQTTVGAMQAFNNVFDRLEAAWKRESGDCAKLREALCEILSYIESFHKYIIPGKREKTTAIFAVADTIRGKARAALAAPPRNCDRPECATTKAAQDVWRREDGGKTAYYEWLLATYKEGGNDGR